MDTQQDLDINNANSRRQSETNGKLMAHINYNFVQINFPLAVVSGALVPFLLPIQPASPRKTLDSSISDT